MMVSLFSGCVEDDYELRKITVPNNLDVSFEVVGVSPEMPEGDGSGAVNFTATAENAMTYKFIYGDGTSEVSYDGTVTHNFNQNGVNDYPVTVVAYGAGGTSSNMTTVVTVFSDFSDPVTKELLTGGNSKTWFIASALPGHLAVGPNNPQGANPVDTGSFSGDPNFGPDCFYDDGMTFSLDSNDNIVYEYKNSGVTFMNWLYTAEFGGDGFQYVDECLPYSATNPYNVSLAPATSGIPDAFTTGTAIEFSTGGFMAYYIGTSTYEILEITDDYLYVRAVQGNNPGDAWYLKFTTAGGGQEPEEFESEYTTLLKEFDFNTAGPLDASVWNFEIGNNNGWGNNESQYYTEDNATLVDGNLVITAQAEEINGFDYTSSRITTKDKFEFKYGRVEARAKLPEGAGTWPAIWMLGATFPEESWPGVGEIDIMEHAGNRQNTIHGTLHYPGRSGGNADGGTIVVPNVSSEFHLYTLEWSPERILFLVDGEVFHSFVNTPDTPFNKDFFLILNVAMGGTFGGEINPDFEESSLIVDYIKVYQ